MNDSPRTSSESRPLDYAAPKRRPMTAAHIFAATYAVVALALGLLSLIPALIHLRLAFDENSDHERRWEWETGGRLMACSLLLLSSAVWASRKARQRPDALQDA
jgi:hypothetical protein